MAIYEYVCDDCEILWEKEYPLALKVQGGLEKIR